MKQIHKTSPDDSAMPNQEHDGLTKREWFAGQAMQGLMSLDSSLIRKPSEIAIMAVAASDALIKELNKSEEK